MSLLRIHMKKQPELTLLSVWKEQLRRGKTVMWGLYAVPNAVMTNMEAPDIGCTWVMFTVVHRFLQWLPPYGVGNKLFRQVPGWSWQPVLWLSRLAQGSAMQENLCYGPHLWSQWCHAQRGVFESVRVSGFVWVRPIDHTARRWQQVKRNRIRED